MDPLTSPRSPLPNHCHLWGPPAPQAATVLSHSIHPYQALTHSHFTSPSDLLTFPCHLHPQRFQTCCHLSPCSSCGPGCLPNADILLSCLLPLYRKTSLSSFPSLAHAPGTAWPTFSFPMPSQKRGTWHFPTSLELWDAFPLCGFTLSCLHTQEGRGLWGPRVRSCLPSKHPHSSSPPYLEELEVKGWEKEDFGHRLGKGWEAIHGLGTPGRTVSSRGTEASTRSRRPGWCWT